MKIHIVQRGDTLQSISEKHRVSVEEVKKLNAHLANPEMIVPGMKIKLPDSAGHKISDHPYADKKPVPYPPNMEMEMEEMGEMKEKEMKEMKERPMPVPPMQPPPIQLPPMQEQEAMPEQWMTQPVPAPTPVEHEMMMMPIHQIPCFFYPIPCPVPYPMHHMMPYMPEVEAEREEEAEEMKEHAWPHMKPQCPCCHK
ncbi:LysM peptidoglycan-binding domain-containing protein [Domibacillus epiphyticus]|uniref:LysM domain-containing protein n=1 Tax=Domibacillus epiphyticus TaxID=1714355 RepID=A0A1V2A9F4_9BACI|nr:LysM domain-containing protein [Domibacillus epiphyticus]OMP67560.1 hypothetical protein BTO28_06335 [Domibacillus epiphyticus]